MQSEVVNKVKDLLITAASNFREDQKNAYREAIDREVDPTSKWVMENVLENALVAEENRSPLCDDTGIPHLLLEIGRNKTVSGEFIEEIYKGIKAGLKELPGRPMAVKGTDLERLDQSLGLFDDPAELAPAPLLVKLIDEDIIRLHVIMTGGGPEIRGKTYRVFHKHDVKNIEDTIVEWALEEVGNLGCTPCTLAVGIGRSHFEASSMMVQAMAYGKFNEQTELEQRITERVNASNVGPLGIGGSTTALATFIKVGPQRASGVRVVSLRPCCCFEPRVHSMEF